MFPQRTISVEIILQFRLDALGTIRQFGAVFYRGPLTI